MNTTERDDATSPLIDPRKADASYKPFPSFTDWSASQVNVSRWKRYTKGLEKSNELPPTLLREAREVVERAAAVDTGAIEGLYDTDRGFTFTVAVQSTLWQTIVEELKGPRVLAFIESQLKAYELILDFATQQVPIAEAWIRTLHSEICSNQGNYTAYTEIGIQELPLPRGEYKHLPNHVLRRDGKIHSHAPVDLTPAEMHRLCNELRSEAFFSAHPVLQASYAHYALVAIHPFADGNGRVARALASVFTYRSSSIPLLILTENKKQYLSSLESADEGNFQPFVDFILERGLDAILLFEQSIRTANATPVDDSIAGIKSLFVTKGGFSQKQVDEAGYKLLDLFNLEINKCVEKLNLGDLIGIRSAVEGSGFQPATSEYRLPVTAGPRRIAVNLSTSPPAQANVERIYNLEVPRDCGSDDDLLIRDMKTDETFEARVNELVPAQSAALQMRMSMAAERIVRDAVKELLSAAKRSLPG